MKKLGRCLLQGVAGLGIATVVALLLGLLRPVELRLGMTGQEADRALLQVIHLPITRSVSLRPWTGVDEKTGLPLEHMKPYYFILPDNTCVFTVQRAPWGASPAPQEQVNGYYFRLPDNRCIFTVQGDPCSTSPASLDAYRLRKIEVGPRFRGYLGKCEWTAAKLAYPQSLDLSLWCWVYWIIGAVVGGASLTAFKRLKKRNRVAEDEGVGQALETQRP